MVADILFAVFIALLLTAIFTAGFRRPGPWRSFWSFFLIVLFGAWLAGIWVVPFGPVLWGVYWAPFVFFAFIVALLLAAATPRPYKQPVPASQAGHEVGDEATRVGTSEDTEADAAALTMLFWILLFVLGFGILIAYL